MLAAKQQQPPHPPPAPLRAADAVDRVVSRKSATPAAITAAAKYPHTPVRDLAAYAPVAPTSTPATTAASAPKTGVAVGTVVGGKWRVTRTLGQGAFGQTFAADELATGRAVAIKIETTPAAPATATAPAKSYLQFETAILRRLQGCPHVSQLVGSGMVPGPPGAEGDASREMQHYMVMSLHGENLSELRKRMPGHRFTPETTAMLARQMISAIRYMHKIGYLHRDIKASNFVMGTEKVPDHHGVPRARCYLIDFGLARRFLTSDGQIRPPRSSAGFRGTARYASLNAHENKELARRDDLWSVLYLLVEFLTGALPWRREKDRHAVYQQKKRIPLAHLLVGTPKWLHDLAAHIQALEFTAEPDYAKLMAILDTVTAPNRHVLYDWEKPPADLARDLGNAARALPPALADASIGIALAQAALAPPTPPPAARAVPAVKDHAAHVATLHQLLDGIARIEAAQIDRWAQQMAEARGDVGMHRTLAEHVRDLLDAGRAPRDVVRHVLGGKATPRVLDAADRIDQVRAEARSMRARIRAAAAAGADPREATGCAGTPVTIERAATPVAAAFDAEHSGKHTPATLPRAAASVVSVASASSTTSPRMLGRLRKWLGGIRGKSTANGTTATATTTTTVPTAVRRRMTPAAVVHADSKWDAPSEQLPVTTHHRAVPAAAPATFPRVAGVKPAGGLLSKLIPRGGKKNGAMGRRARAGSSASAAAASSSAAPLV
ncbi:CK1/TTBK protein kinase [Allomyces macrogynus ATCC 38327]|uniref:non-specific serine/threonine protein kinase n=1 Tax=Allomyces macrogynus (strain ATCC 38327) TaxID=578462 RepID=A0A0L0T5U5_ALLM3|nr:CK1/TTBK protein kinase [Allomyces macrogynus ATCC 38327]|eukprot:KNE70120.1 CK1/TTBK protein kinase [Allomyces macrogynus ATCC 38327]